MPVPAVPAYLGGDFSGASPGMRFGLLLSIWTSRQDQEAHVQKHAAAEPREDRKVKEMPALWKKNAAGAHTAWNAIRALTPADQARMQAIVERQLALGDRMSAGSMLRLTARATAPFTTGLGNEHPLENGFAFLNPYGLPYLPGSGVKGVARQAARELASGVWGETRGWSTEPGYPLMRDADPVLDRSGQPVLLSMLDVLFGRETLEGEAEHVRGALTFWDVIPWIIGDKLMVEVMTPHQSHYYQIDKEKVRPHDSGQPNPISFLTVPHGSRFVFHVVCDLALLRRVTRCRTDGAPDLLAGGDTHWKALLQVAFEHAFAWLGFGAKTAVGYGAMSRAEEPAAQPGSKAGPAPPDRSSVDARTSAVQEQIRALRIQDRGRIEAIARAIEQCPAEERSRLWAALRQQLGDVGWREREIRRLAERYPGLTGGS